MLKTFNTREIRHVFLKKKSSLTTQTLVIILTSAYLIKTYKANLDLSQGRFSLFMDEQLTFDGVRQILNPQNPLMFIYAITDGGDQRYGRLLWNISAIFAFFPEKVFGEGGQIVSTRMLSVVLIVIAAGLLAKTFTESDISFFIVYSTILALPFVSYYSTMPKPEPLQLLLVGLIAHLIVKKSDFGTKKLFILFGLLLGIKISSLSLLIPILFWLIRQSSESLRVERRGISWRLASFCLGMFIAVPTLLPTLAIITASSFVWEKYLKSKKFSGFSLLTSLVAAWFIGVAVNNLIALAVNRNFLKNYLNYTIFGTSHGSDAADVTPLTWIQYFFTDWSPISTQLLVALLALISILLFRAIGARCRSFQFKPKIAFFISGIFSMGTTFLGVNRIWGFYLFIGSAILISASLGLISDWVTNNHIAIFDKFVLNFAICFLALFSFFSLERNFNELDQSALRTKSTEYRLQQQSFQKIQSTIRNFSSNQMETFRMALDPNYFQMENLPNVVIERFWGPFNGWGDYDLIVLKPAHLPPFSNLGIGTLEEKARAAAVISYYDYVVSRKDECLQDFCYVPLIELPDKGRIFQKMQGNPKN